jgi:hypothetical protein
MFHKHIKGTHIVERDTNERSFFGFRNLSYKKNFVGVRQLFFVKTLWVYDDCFLFVTERSLVVHRKLNHVVFIIHKCSQFVPRHNLDVFHYIQILHFWGNLPQLLKRFVNYTSMNHDDTLDGSLTESLTHGTCGCTVNCMCGARVVNVR